MKAVCSIAMGACAGLALVSCSEPHASGQASATGSLGYESAAPVQRAPLAPLQGYAVQPPLAAPGAGAGQDSALGWQASPRWAAIKGNGCIEVEPDPQAKSAGQGGSGMRIEKCQGEKAGALPQDEQAPPDDVVEMAPQDADPNMPAPE